jgi:hypothetical protein
MEESFKEKEDLTAEGHAETAHLPLSGGKHKLVRLIKEMWPAYLIEIVVIILGISITLALEAWRDQAKENELENIYQRNLLADLEADVQSLRSVREYSRNIISHGNELMGFSRYPQDKEITPARVAEDVRAILSRPKFLSSNATFSDLKSSGNLHLLRDIQLKSMLFEYYNQSESIKEQQDAEQQATITLSGNYFLKKFPLADSSSINSLSGPNELSEVLKSIEFENNVLLRILTRKELLESYQIADSIAGRLLIDLGKKTDD